MGLEEDLLAEVCVNRGGMVPSNGNHPVSNNPLATLSNSKTSSGFVCSLAFDGLPGLVYPELVLYHYAMSCNSSFPHVVFVRSNFHWFIKYLLSSDNVHSKLQRFKTERAPPSCIVHLPSVITYETRLEQCLRALLTSLSYGAVVSCFFAGRKITFVMFRWSVSHAMAQQD